jgi:hypothetical protein
LRGLQAEKMAALQKPKTKQNERDVQEEELSNAFKEFEQRKIEPK